MILKNAQVRPSAPIDFCDPYDPYYHIKSKNILHTLLQGYRKYQHLAAGHMHAYFDVRNRDNDVRNTDSDVQNKDSDVRNIDSDVRNMDRKY